MTPESLGFAAAGADAWTKSVRGREILFRSLHRLDDMIAIEAIEREVFGVSETDLFPASGLVGVPETGGHVLAAYAKDCMVGAIYGFGGYVNDVPRIVSDWMGILPDFRSFGLGAELKKLQAAVAFGGGFQEIVWTVDPLRAANARLNFERLGAWAGRYEENRYGDTYGASLYGGLPTDRLHMTWDITDPEVAARLNGEIPPRSARDVSDLEHFDPRAPAPQALIYLPSDIDQILATDLSAALRWRLILRETIQSALDEGYIIRGFVPGIAGDGELAAYLIQRREGARPQ
jgi:predicted GNAT superfamily acetyltransferase